MRRLRSVSAAVFVIVCCALVGGLFGRQALVAQDQLPEQYRVFASALSAVEQQYVGEADSERLVYSAISGMLQTLDPHSSFMDPRSYAQMRERQEGRYYGLGISISVNPSEGDITVANVFEGSPAYQKGLRRGDVIARIEGEDAKGWTTEQAVARLRGDMIVYTRGRVANSGQEYRASDRSEYLDIPVVTLVNRSSASASEIVAGALQDHDRALIVGETTFGKALVQSVFRIGSAGAAITTARYYTPSGRLIQRPWDGTFDEYLTYALREQETTKEHRSEDLKLTDSGRHVYSGGGIEPDRRLDGQVMGFNPTRFGRTLYARNLFASFGERFTRSGDTRIAPSSTTKARELSANFEVTDAMVAEFRQHVEQQNVRIDEEAWKTDQAFIRAMLRFEIDLDLFGVATAWQHLVADDPQVQFALGLFPEAQQLLETGRQQDRTRRAGR